MHEFKESTQNPNEKMICDTCGNDSFRVYITVFIDDARLYCARCGEYKG
jgi:hypothetical protein